MKTQEAIGVNRHNMFNMLSIMEIHQGQFNSSGRTLESPSKRISGNKKS